MAHLCSTLAGEKNMESGLSLCEILRVAGGVSSKYLRCDGGHYPNLYLVDFIRVLRHCTSAGRLKPNTAPQHTNKAMRTPANELKLLLIGENH